MVQRLCTAELKVRTFHRYMHRGLQQKEFTNLLGLRYDEPKPWGKALFEECRVDYPLVHARITRREVDAFWRASSFDLKIPSEWSNCDLCFLKRRETLIQYMRQFPTASKWWSHQEHKVLHHRRGRIRNPAICQFSKRYSYTDLSKCSPRVLSSIKRHMVSIRIGAACSSFSGSPAPPPL